MTTFPQLNTGYIIASVIAIVFMIFYPLALGFFANKRLHVGWKYFGFGALIFFLFQIITRVPLTQVAALLLGSALKGNIALQIAWGAVLALTAGLFEEIGRYVGYRWLMGKEEKTWSKAVMYGIGHGGLESILLVGGIAAIQLISFLALESGGPQMLPDEVSRQAVADQFNSINALPGWYALIGAWERLWTLPFHIAMSVVVLQVFRRNSMNWLWLAVMLHAALDFITPTIIPLLISDTTVRALVQEAIIALAGLFSIWLIFRFRDQPTTPAGEPQPVSGPEPASAV